MTFSVVIEANKRNQKIWVATVPLLPDCSVMGSGMTDVLAKTEEAIQKYFKRNVRHFALMPSSIKCRMITKEEFAAMDDRPLGVQPVIVGAGREVRESIPMPAVAV